MTYQELIPHFTNGTKVILEKAGEDLASVRTGRASPALVENLLVEAYGAKMRLMELAAITTDGAQAIVVQPFDGSLVQGIEKAIMESPLGISPSNQGGRLFVKIPPLSEEQRGKLIKLTSQIVEDKRNAARLVREEVKRHLKHMFEKKEVSEDLKFKAEKDLDAAAKDVDTKLLELRDRKEREIKEV